MEDKRRAARPFLMAALMAASILSPVASASAAPEKWNAKAREILSTLVPMQTVQGRGQVPKLAHYLSEQLQAAGFPKSDIHILPEGETAAFVVRYRGDPASVKKPILLLAHMDVVDAAAEDWTVPPFELTEKDGYLYGRGTFDAKQAVAVLTTELIRLKAEGYRPQRDLIVAFSGDEESGMKTTTALVTKWRHLIDAEYALNADAGNGAFSAAGKPIAFFFQAAEKNSVHYSLTVTNKGGHSSSPRDDNAITELADALTKVGRYRFKPRINEITRASFLASAAGRNDPTADAMRRFAKNPADVNAADLIEKDSAYIGTTRTTCVTTMIEGGHARNALAQTATANLSCRIFPGVSAEEVAEELKQVIDNPAVQITLTHGKVGAPASPLRKDVFEAYKTAVQSRIPDMPVVPEQASYATDGRELRAAGIPTYGVDGLWLVYPEDDRAHGRDERIPIKSFYENLDHWHSMIKSLAGE